jgi:hypothetical protein
MWRILMLFLMVQTPVLSPNEPLQLDLARDEPVVEFSVAAGDVVSLSAHSLEAEPLDLTLEILRDKERLAFNDDHRGDTSDLAPSDDSIEALLLEVDGIYQVRVANFNGLSTGRVELRLTVQPQLTDCTAGEIDLPANRVYRCTLALSAGQTLTLSAHDLSGGLDPMLRLLAPDGALLAVNDDHVGLALGLNLLDSQLAAVAIPAAGRYTLELRDFAGQAGPLTLAIISS